MTKDVIWEKHADKFLNSMSNIHLLTEEESDELTHFMISMVESSNWTYLKIFINKCREIKSIDPFIFSQNYENTLFNGFIDCMSSQNKEALNLWLTSDLLDIHKKDIGAGHVNLVWVASMGLNCELLKYLVEKNVDFTHKSKNNNNMFHQLGIFDGSDNKTMSLACLDYLMNQNDKVRLYLENTNYEMLHEENDKGLGPVVMYLRCENPQLALLIINQLSNFEALEKIQSQITAYCTENELSEDSLKVVARLNEKIMIKNEKNTLSTVIQDSKNGLEKTRLHKI